MKRLVVIVAALLTLAGVSAVTATASSASVCEPDGTGCTPAGTYPGPNAVISNDYTGFKVVWTESVVQPYSSGVPLYWTAYVTYTNIGSSTLTLSCSGNVTDTSADQEHMSGGSGDDGTVGADSTTCSQNPSFTEQVPPGGTGEAYATFHNVPWPGSSVAITWGDAGTSPPEYPFGASAPAPSSLVDAVNWALDNKYTNPLTGNNWITPVSACEQMVEEAYGTKYIYATAKDDYTAQKNAGRIHTDVNAPRGALVFFVGADPSSGHVGLAYGNGADYYTVDGGTIHEALLSEGLTYEGWSYAPADWPGR